jgi:hypothetical protein
MTASVLAFVAEQLLTLRAGFTQSPTPGAPASTFPFGALRLVHGWIQHREDRRFDRVQCDAGSAAVAFGDTLRLRAALVVSGELAHAAHAAREPAVRVRLRRQTP